VKFSILHPTARVKPMGSFPYGWAHAYEDFHISCSHPEEVEYVLVVHHSRIASFYSNLSILMVGRTWGRFQVVVNYGRDCVVDQCNAGLLACSGEIVLGIMDDLAAPPSWDTRILEAIPDTGEAVCLGCNPRQRPDLLTLPTIATRVLIDQIGPISPEYESMFSDNEWSIKARQLGQVREVAMFFEHRHPITNGAAQMDEVYVLQNSKWAYNLGKAVFESRQAAGFPKVKLPGWPVEAVKPVNPITRALDWLDKRMFPDSAAPVVAEKPGRNITFCLPGETFRFEWLSGLVDLCSQVGAAGWQIRLCFGYSTSCYTTRINISQDVIDGAAAARPEYVFWLDDDNIVKPDAFLRLLAFLDSTPSADVVTGWCWIRQKERWGISVGTEFWTDGVHLCPIELDQLFADNGRHKRIAHTGFPCVLMRYSVLEKLGPYAFMPVLRPDLPTWFAGEDVAFCLRARDAGVEMWVDPSCKVAHLKTISQEPDIQLFRDSPKDLKDWRAQVNGPAIVAPENWIEVIK